MWYGVFPPERPVLFSCLLLRDQTIHLGCVCFSTVLENTFTDCGFNVGNISLKIGIVLRPRQANNGTGCREVRCQSQCLSPSSLYSVKGFERSVHQSSDKNTHRQPWKDNWSCHWSLLHTILVFFILSDAKFKRVRWEMSRIWINIRR